MATCACGVPMRPIDRPFVPLVNVRNGTMKINLRHSLNICRKYNGSHDIDTFPSPLKRLERSSGSSWTVSRNGKIIDGNTRNRGVYLILLSERNILWHSKSSKGRFGYPIDQVFGCSAVGCNGI